MRGLGFDPADVRRIAVTHLDLDHAGGLPDFPAAGVHVFAPERAAAVRPKLRDRPRYPASQSPTGRTGSSTRSMASPGSGSRACACCPASTPEIVLIPLVGHTAGHSAIAVRRRRRLDPARGDAYFHRGEVASPPSCPPALRAFQAAMAADNSARTSNQERLRELGREHGDEVRIFCAHDPVELEREQGR